MPTLPEAVHRLPNVTRNEGRAQPGKQYPDKPHRVISEGLRHLRVRCIYILHNT